MWIGKRQAIKKFKRKLATLFRRRIDFSKRFEVKRARGFGIKARKRDLRERENREKILVWERKNLILVNFGRKRKRVDRN